jgi:hypothetical protein
MLEDIISSKHSFSIRNLLQDLQHDTSDRNESQDYPMHNNVGSSVWIGDILVNRFKCWCRNQFPLKMLVSETDNVLL